MSKSKEEIFNSHSWAELGAISPSKNFCLKAMDEWGRQEAKDFFIWYGVKILSLLDYIKTVKSEMGITSQEMEEKIKEFEGKPIDELYNQFQKSKQLEQK